MNFSVLKIPSFFIFVVAIPSMTTKSWLLLQPMSTFKTTPTTHPPHYFPDLYPSLSPDELKSLKLVGVY